MRQPVNDAALLTHLPGASPDDMGVDVVVRVYQPADEDEVVDLWNRCQLVVPANDPRGDIARKQEVQPDLLLVGTVRGRVVATVMAGYDGHRGWINYLAVSPDFQRRGIGRRMMEEAEQKLRELGCPKVNLQVRGSNAGVVEFYTRIGYAVEERVSLGKRID